MKIIGSAAFAKINLGLEVLHKRSDGFHEINTIFARINLFDTFALHTLPDMQDILVELRPECGIAPEDNLIYKAADLLRRTANIKEGAHIIMEKRIPMGAGLGGGSSDAASTLFALSTVWKPTMTISLAELGASLGSDVPFFLLNAPSAVGTGRGELLEPLSYTLPYWVVVVYPEIQVSTAWAYSSLSLAENRSATPFKEILHQSVDAPELLGAHLVNDFEPVVFERYPFIGEIKKNLYDAGALFALMSGSGSSVFGLFTEEQQAHDAAGLFNHYHTFVCSPLDIHQ